MSNDPVLVEIDEGVAVITLNRPKVRNALDTDTLQLLPKLVVEADGNDEVDVLILTGADPAFCAGLDLKQLGSTGDNLRPLGPNGASSSSGHRGPLPPTAKPLIGAINGPAITGGLELALACDFLVGSHLACFADTHARVGVHPDWGLSVLLPQTVGIRRAREMSATGRLIDAVSAREWGLVNHVVPHDELLPFCRELAAEIRGGDQAMVRRLFETYDAVVSSTADPAWEAERRGTQRWLNSGGLNSGEVAKRSDTIIRRGSSQLG